MSQTVVRNLRDENAITWSKDGVATIFDRDSVKEFQKEFNRYIPKSECSKKIKNYVTEVVQPTKNKRTIGISISPCGIYVSCKKLMTGGGDIPDEYRLDVKEFGKAPYITKESFAKTLKWLEELHRKENPVQPLFVPNADWKPSVVGRKKRKIAKRPYTKPSEAEVEEHKRWVEEMKRERKERDEQFKVKVGFGRLKVRKRSVPA